MLRNCSFQDHWLKDSAYQEWVLKDDFTNTSLDVWHAKFSSFFVFLDGPYKSFWGPYLALVQVPGNHVNLSLQFTLFLHSARCILHYLKRNSSSFCICYRHILYLFCAVVLTLPVELAPHSTNSTYKAKNETGFKTFFWQREWTLITSCGKWHSSWWKKLPTQQKRKPVLKHSSDKGSKLLSLPVYHADIPVGGRNTSFLKHSV